jgi:superfamily I DNA/RNA helicase
VQTQGALFDDQDTEAEVPDILRVMDLQQEQLARSLGEGHRVIHGVAGSGKTMILGYRAEYLARSTTVKPILVLCYNEPLAVKLASIMEAKGLAHRVHARHFHKWCRDQLVSYGQLPTEKMSTSKLMDEFVDRVIRGVERKQIPSGQYHAILIDEGHDFRPEWLKLVTQMVDPATNSLLLLYDDAQSIYERQRTKQFSFKSVGIQAQGRTTVLRINYRNTKQILQTASLIAADLLTAEDKDDDGIPLLHPISCGREGHAPLIVRLPTLRDEARKVAELLSAAHEEGHAWGDMAVICRHYAAMEECASAFRWRKLPHQVRRGSGTFNPDTDAIKVLTAHASKGLEFAVVALMGLGKSVSSAERDVEESRLFYVGATRATSRLIITLDDSAALS